MATDTGVQEHDALVVGAGFSGLRMLYELRQQGLSVTVLEAGDDVGGTWYWNRYPGARTDTESWVYAYSFSTELQDGWDWKERYPTQGEALSYLNHVADRFDLRRDITFGSRVVSAHYDGDDNRWTVETENGLRYRCKFFITAVGPLSMPYRPDFGGLDEFRGRWLVTSRWPHEGVDVAGKRVAVVGTGATGVQVIPVVAKTAASLTVFQRTANYVLPARNYTLTQDERREIRDNYESIWAEAREHVFGFQMSPSGRLALQAPAEELHKVFEWAWELGGHGFIFETFDDIVVDATANQHAADFVRAKIRAIVDDPVTAEALCPHDHPLCAKRPPLGHMYFETYNRANVELVPVRNNPIDRITPDGVRTSDGVEHPADVIIFATGFDASTGSVTAMDIRGRGGLRLQDHWEAGPRTYLGLAVDQFPNMFVIAGPHTPFANLPVWMESAVEWISRAICYLRDHDDVDVIEASAASVDRWAEHIDEMLAATVIGNGDSLPHLGDNIPGKAHAVQFYFGGVGNYTRECLAAEKAGYDGFELTVQ